MLLTPRLGENDDSEPGLLDVKTLFASERLVSALAKGFMPRALKLLMTISVLLATEDLRKLGPLMWEEYLESGDDGLVLSVSGLDEDCVCCLVLNGGCRLLSLL
jgi:hypothetical protein